MAIVMRYGTPSDSQDKASEQYLSFISGGDVLDNSVITLTPEPGGIYLLFTAEWTASTGARYGHRAYMITGPRDEVYGTVAVGSSGITSSGSAGVTVSFPTDSTVTIKQANSTRNFSYAWYRVL